MGIFAFFDICTVVFILLYILTIVTSLLVEQTIGFKIVAHKHCSSVWLLEVKLPKYGALTLIWAS